MMKTFNRFVFLLACLCLTRGYVVKQQETQHEGQEDKPKYISIPVMYAVDKTKTGACTEGEPSKEQHFVAHMCAANEKLYANQKVTVSLNTPYAEWNPDVGDVVYSEAHSNGKLLGSNGDADEEFSWQQSYTFVYDTTNDIFISVRTGTCTGSLSYTLQLSFNGTNPVEFPASPAATSPKESPFVRSKKSVMFQRVMESIHQTEYQSLNQIFKLQKQGTVKTKECDDYSLAYCFGESPKYTVSVSVIASDASSGFGTYICPYSSWQKYGRCIQSKATAKDQSGSPANFVASDINEDDKCGAVLTRVCGNGRFESENNFFMSSTGPKFDA